MLCVIFNCMSMLAGVCESDLPKPKFIVHIYSVTYIPKSIHAIHVVTQMSKSSCPFIKHILPPATYPPMTFHNES